MPFRCPELPHCRAHSRHPDRALSNRHRPATSEALDLMIDDSEQGSRGVRGAGPSEGRPPRPEAHTCRLSSRYILNKIIGATNPRPLLLVRRAPDPRPLNRADQLHAICCLPRVVIVVTPVRCRACWSLLHPWIVRGVGIHRRTATAGGFGAQFVVPGFVAVDLAQPVLGAVLG
jgi:hypothetical protein